MMTNANNTTTMRIRHEANLTSYGTHHNGNCKPIIAVDLHKTFNSLLDAAEFFGVDAQRIWSVLNVNPTHTIGLWERDENGNKIRRICKCRLTYASHMESTVDALMACGRESTEKLNKANERIAELETKNKELEAELAELRAWKMAREMRDEAMRKARAELEQSKADEQAAIERRRRAELAWAEMEWGGLSA